MKGEYTVVGLLDHDNSRVAIESAENDNNTEAEYDDNIARVVVVVVVEDKKDEEEEEDDVVKLVVSVLVVEIAVVVVVVVVDYVGLESEERPDNEQDS